MLNQGGRAMKKFEKPEIDVIRIVTQSIMDESVVGDVNLGENQLPWK